MTERILALVALATLLGFLGILFFEVTRLDLGIVLGIAVGFAAWDLWRGADKG